MSKTYPKKTHCETLFAGHISLQRRIRLQRYYKISTPANFEWKNLQVLWVNGSTICTGSTRGCKERVGVHTKFSTH